LHLVLKKNEQSFIEQLGVHIVKIKNHFYDEKMQQKLYDLLIAIKNQTNVKMLEFKLIQHG
jgi:hypothetical protein